MRLKPLLALPLALTASAVLYAQQSLKTFSPSGYIQLETVLNNTGELQYRLLFKNKEAVGLSSLGLRLSTPAIELNRFSVVNIDSTSKDETWETVWGEDHRIRNNYREIITARLPTCYKTKAARLLNCGSCSVYSMTV